MISPRMSGSWRMAKRWETPESVASQMIGPDIAVRPTAATKRANELGPVWLSATTPTLSPEVITERATIHLYRFCLNRRASTIAVNADPIATAVNMNPPKNDSIGRKVSELVTELMIAIISAPVPENNDEISSTRLKNTRSIRVAPLPYRTTKGTRENAERSMRKLIELVNVATWPTVALDDFRAAIAQNNAPPSAMANKEIFKAMEPLKIVRCRSNSFWLGRTCFDPPINLIILFAIHSLRFVNHRFPKNWDFLFHQWWFWKLPYLLRLTSLGPQQGERVHVLATALTATVAK